MKRQKKSIQRKKNKIWLKYKNQQNAFAKHRFPNAWKWRK